MATFQGSNATSHSDTKAIKLYEQGLALVNQDRQEEAIAAFDEALKLKPNVVVAWISRGVALERLGLHAQALASHEQAIRLEPQNFLAWYNKGIQLQELSRYPEAIVAHEYALKLQPNDIDTLYNLGVELEKVERYSEALATYEQVLRQTKDDSYTWNRRGIVLDHLGKYAEAVDSYDKALVSQPNLAEAWSNRGWTLYNLQKYQEAINSFDQALTINPKDKGALNNRSLAQSKLEVKIAALKQPIPPSSTSLTDHSSMTFTDHSSARLSDRGGIIKGVVGGVTIGATPQTPATPIPSQEGITIGANPQKQIDASDISAPRLTISNPTKPTITTTTGFNSLETPVLAPLEIAGRTFTSRLMTGTGKYRSMEETQQSILASGCQIVTVAVRRVQANADWQQGLAQSLDWTKLWMLPNTAGCQTAEEAVRVARLGREMAKLMGQEDNNFVKLEVIPDAKYLLPDPIGTLEAAETLVDEGFVVLPYINADPILAERLQAIGCATLMPLGSPIGSGQGIQNAANIAIIIENAVVPVIVDAGIGTPSEAAQAMEMGADALLVNTAIAQAQNPALMAQAMAMATVAGRLAYLAGRIPVRSQAQASSPLTGTITGSP